MAIHLNTQVALGSWTKSILFALGLTMLFQTHALAQEIPLCPNVLKKDETQIVLSPSTKLRLQDSHPLTFTDSKGHQLFYQVVAPAAVGRPTLFMLPGVNRSLLPKDQAIQALAEQGFGVVMFQYSTQLFSVAHLPEDSRPAFLDQSPSLEDLAREAQELALFLRGQGVDDLVPLSLSFSGAVSPLLKDFPVAIDVVPMTSTVAAGPILGQLSSGVDFLGMFNPFFSMTMKRHMMDQFYRSHWQKEAKEKTEEFHLRPSAIPNIIEGYTAMSRSIEGFDWKNIDPSHTTRRLFMLAAEDDRDLLEHQMATYRALREKGYPISAVVVLDSAHRLPLHQPQAYVSLIAKFLTPGAFPAGLSILDPKTRTLTSVAVDDEDQVFQNILQQTTTGMERAFGQSAP